MLVSVIMPCYNVSGYIRRSIDSVLSQTHTDFELIAVNDGSTDDTGEILKAYAEQDSRIVVLEQPNGGVSKARNTGIDRAKGEILLPLDADDWLAPNCLAEAVRCMQETGCEVCYCGSENVDEQGNHSANESTQYPQEDRMSNQDILFQKSLRHIWLHTGNVFYRRSLLERHHLRYPEGFRYGEDNHFINSCLLFANGIACIPQVLMYCLLRSGSATHTGFTPAYIDAVHLNRQFCQTLREIAADKRLFTACDIDYIQLLTACAKNVVDHVRLFQYAEARRKSAEFGISSASHQVCREAIDALPRMKRLEWTWFCRHPLLFFFSVKTHRLLKK